MAEYIEKGAAKHAVDLAIELNDTEYDMICNQIDQVPAADVAPVRHGRWQYPDMYDVGDTCSACSFDSYIAGCKWTYCPGCGAKMDGAE